MEEEKLQTDKEIDAFIKRNMTFKLFLKIIPELGTLELFTAESKIIKEFFRRSELKEQFHNDTHNRFNSH